MKRVLRAIARRLWRLTDPVRRPLIQRFHGTITRLVANVVEERAIGPILPRLDLALASLERLEQGVNCARHEVNNVYGVDTNLALDGLVREVTRLQRQLDALREIVEESRGLAVVGDDAEDAGGMMKVG